VYAKFMKELLTGRRKPKDDENIALSENCNAILQNKLPLKMKVLVHWRFLWLKCTLSLPFWMVAL